MPSLGLSLSLDSSSSRILTTTLAGIPVASTNLIYVDGFDLFKQSPTLYSNFTIDGVEDCGGDQTRDYGYQGQLEFFDGSWLYKYGPYNGCSETWNFSTYTNSSTNSNFIPTSGWSPSITITPA